MVCRPSCSRRRALRELERKQLGEFHAVIAPTTPTGLRRVYTKSLGLVGGDRATLDLIRQPGKVVPLRQLPGLPIISR